MSAANLFQKVVGFFTSKKEKEPEVQEETTTFEEVAEVSQPVVYNHRRKPRNYEQNN